MEFTAVKNVLSGHLKSLKVAVKGNRKLGKLSRVKISAAENCTVSMHGFMQELEECEVIKWGTVSMPVEIWRRFLEVTEKVKQSAPFTVEIGDGYIKLGTYTIEHFEIIPEPTVGIAVELPINATPKDIIEFVLGHDIELLKSSDVWGTARASLKNLQKHIRASASHLREYGISEKDLAGLISEKLSGKKNKDFVETFFNKSDTE